MELTWTLPMTASVESAGAATRPDAELVAAARDGDGDAFGELVRRHQRRVFRLAGRFFRPGEVEDAAQQTFLKAWEKLDTYRASAPFEHWLTRVCLNTCYQRLRRARPVEELEEERLAMPAGDPDARLEVERLLRRLPATDRFVLVLMHGEGWTTAEIARRLGWTRANVKVRAHRARKKLRELVEQEDLSR